MNTLQWAPKLVEHTPTATWGAEPALPATFNPLAGSSAAMALLNSQIQRVAPYFRTAMLSGQRHCGDLAAARRLHQLSPLAGRPFVTLNATDAELMLGEGFPPAAILEAGLLYLPAPERLGRSAQMTLLRLLRRKPLPPRIVLYAEHGLRALVSTGGFSAELESTLSALRITLPSLRDRAEDIPTLLTSLLDGAPAQPQLHDAARDHAWPENLRQLAGVAELLRQRAATHPSTLLTADDLQTALAAVPTGPPKDRRAPRLIPLEQALQEHVRAVLMACNGNKLRAAEVLCISRSTLYRMLEGPGNIAAPLSLAG